MKYEIPHAMTLLDALSAISPESSKTTLRSWLKDGRVSVDGKAVKVGSSALKKGQFVMIGSRTHPLEQGVQIIYEDSDLVIIYKPKGLLTVSTPFETQKTAHAILKAKYKPRRVHVIHRLDQDTSGVMMFALNDKARDHLKTLFEKHDIDREYTAIVEGHLKSREGTWSSYLYEDNVYMVHSTPDPQKGVLAITHYKVESTSKNYSRLLLRLETGKKNQIRVHCRDAGCAIVGDKKYGALTNPIKRVALHAHYLAFVHPTTGKKMKFSSAVPPSFERISGGGHAPQ